MSDAGRSDEAPIFTREGEALVPSEVARGPWYPGTQHGSPMLGLLARAIEIHPSERPMQAVRLTADLSRAAPLAPVTTASRCIHASRSIELIEATLDAGGETYARAVGMRFRQAGFPDLPDASDFEEPVPHFPEHPGKALAFDGSPEGRGIHSVIEFRAVDDFATPAAWLRLRAPLVEGEVTSGFQRAAFLSDMTYSIPFLRWLRRDRSVLKRRPFLAINPDTTLNLHRNEIDEWICLDSRAHYDASGAGSALARVYDRRGPIGSMSQTLFLREVGAVRASWEKYVK